MAIYREKFTFTAQALSQTTDPAERQAIIDWKAKLELFDWEDALLYQFLTTDFISAEEDLPEVEVWVDIMRGNQVPIRDYDVEEINSPEWIEAATWQDDGHWFRLLRTIYLCICERRIGVAMEMTRRLDPLVIQNLGSLWPNDAKTLLFKFYVILYAYFFSFTLGAANNYFFGSALFVLSVELGFNWEEILKMLFGSMSNFSLRKAINLELAASLTENKAVVGVIGAEQARTVSDWIESLRSVAGGDFSEQVLLRFINQNRSGGVSGMGENVEIILRLYSHLVTGYFIVPENDLAVADQAAAEAIASGRGEDIADYLPQGKEPEEEFVPAPLNVYPGLEITPDLISKFIGFEFGPQQADGQYRELERMLARLAQMAQDFKNPDIANWYYFDEAQGKFKWQTTK